MKPSDYAKTAVLAALVLIVALQKFAGFVVLLLVPVFAVSALYSAVRMVRRPAERKTRAVRLGIWAATLILAGAVQAHRGSAARNNAEAVARAVLAHKAGTGAFPATLGEIGLDGRKLDAAWGIRYFLREGKPVLAYPATFMPLTTLDYDFETRTWRLNAS